MKETKYLYPVSFIILGFAIGLALGFFLGAVALVEVFQQFTEGVNASITIDFDEAAAIDYMIETMEIDNETRRILEEAKTHPEQRDISQTVQNFKGFVE